MKKIVLSLLLVFGLTTLAVAADGKTIAKQKGISASSKASSQWQRKFDKGDEPFSGLSDADKKALLDYLVSHAADSNTPEAAGA